jgi:hypothetical protein
MAVFEAGRARVEINTTPCVLGGEAGCTNMIGCSNSIIAAVSLLCQALQCLN